MNETRAILQIQSDRFKSLEMQIGPMAKVISEEQERRLPTCGELKRVEVDAKVLNEIIGKDKQSTSPNKKR